MKETKGNQEEPIKIKREIKSGTNTKQLIHKYKSLKKLKRQITHLNLRGECIELKKKKKNEDAHGFRGNEKNRNILLNPM